MLKVALKGRDLKQYNDRIGKRTQRHPEWRQTYIDCTGMCQFPIEEGIICAELEGLEFHEVYILDDKNNLIRIYEVLLCNYHHWSIHGAKWVNERHYPSMLQFDIQLEIETYGSYQNWLKEFNLIDRRVDYDLEIDTKGHPTDLNDSQDS